MPSLPNLAHAITADPQLWEDFLRICACGGRLAGTASERRAFAYVEAQAEAATGVTGQSLPVAYGGWSLRSASLTVPGGTVAACHPLLRTVATAPGGLTAEVVDLGRGTS